MNIIATTLLAASVAAANAIAADYRDFIPEVTEPNKESVEWTIHYGFNTQDKKTPRVLLIGDSICNGYQGSVRQQLEKKMSVSYWVSSFCVTHPQYMETLDAVLKGPKPQVVLFNNGLHTPKDQDYAVWKAAYLKVLAFLKAQLPQVPILIVNSTPLREDAEGYVEAINKATREIAQAEKLELVDLHSFCNPWNRAEKWADRYHFIPECRTLQGEFLVPFILKALPAGTLNNKAVQQESEKGPDGKIK